jgi:hypothetical protein
VVNVLKAALKIVLIAQMPILASNVYQDTLYLLKIQLLYALLALLHAEYVPKASLQPVYHVELDSICQLANVLNVDKIVMFVFQIPLVLLVQRDTI